MQVVKTNKKLILTMFIGVILLSSLVFAQGIFPPNRFYGSVFYNGQPAPDGLSVVAKINGVEAASTTTSDGKYVFNVKGEPGDTINFFVNGIDTGQIGTFRSGAVTRLDLTASGPPITTTTVPETTTTISGGGGGGGGGTTTTTTTTVLTTIVTPTEEEPACIEKWVCTEWGLCVDEIQTRTCTDENECGTDLYKPIESQPCSKEEIEEQMERQKNPLTAFITFVSSPMNLALIIVTVLIVIGLIIFAVRKYPSRKKPYKYKKR